MKLPLILFALLFSFTNLISCTVEESDDDDTGDTSGGDTTGDDDDDTSGDDDDDTSGDDDDDTGEECGLLNGDCCTEESGADSPCVDKTNWNVDIDGPDGPATCMCRAECEPSYCPAEELCLEIANGISFCSGDEPLVEAGEDCSEEDHLGGDCVTANGSAGICLINTVDNIFVCPEKCTPQDDCPEDFGCMPIGFGDSEEIAGGACEPFAQQTSFSTTIDID